MKKLLTFPLVFSIMISAQSLSAKTLQWFGSEVRGAPSTTDWMDGSAWGDEFTGPPLVHGVVPTAYDSVKINSEWGNPGPIVDEAVTAGEIKLSEIVGSTLEQTLTVVQGGSLVTGTPGYDGTPASGYSGQIIISYYTGNVGTLIIDGGSITAAGTLYAGYGGSGTVLLNSGTLTVSALYLGRAGGDGRMNIDSGKLIINDFVDYLIQEYVDNGWITGYGLEGNIDIKWDEENYRTIVTAIPEPVSIVLLGLGALLLKRRS